MTSRNNNAYEYIIFTGTCPDEKCKMKLYFPYFEDTILCHQCGQRHTKQSLKDMEEIKDIDSVFRNVLRGMLMNSLPKRGTEAVKVLGLSNYHCKLLSPLLTKHGMDKETGKAKPLSEMNQGDIFDCGLFGDRAFLIDPEHISIPGFGRDVSGSMKYLQSTLDHIKTHNNNEERLVPIHADGDGHCLVHAISRALVGRELFWHPLRCSLKRHLEENLSSYKELFKEFVDESDWKTIVDECDPEFLPSEGEILGLRNIHVFGLANVLKRPIILLDSLEYMDKMGDYAALFLPSMVQPEFCKGKDGHHLNKPLCIAWSSEGHNHYIPLVGIKKRPLPVLPKQLLPKVWGVPQNQIEQYIEFDESDCCTIGGDRSLGDPYILRLVSAMEELFFSLNSVHPNLVSDVHHYLYASTGAVSVKPSAVVSNTHEAIDGKRLYRCLTCNAINEQILPPEWLKRTGLLYNMVLRTDGVLRSGQLYAFPARGIFCKYDANRDELVSDPEMSFLEKCSCCEGSSLRRVNADGSIIYKNRDRTKTPSESSICGCGFKHYWNEKEYDNLPQQINLNLEWKGKVIKDVIAWFQHETDTSLNSNVYQVADEVVQKHFPGEFGIEGLQNRIVQQLLEQSELPGVPVADFRTPSPSKVSKDDCLPHKIIIGGSGVLHREELGVSLTEQQILRRIETRASKQQKRQALAKTESPVKSLATVAVKVEPKTYSQVQSLKDNIVRKVAESSKFVRVVTSDGRQGKLDIGDGITFETLQQWISDNFQIAPDNQTIKHGFPPQVLDASSAERGSVLSLSPGQRIVVEVSQSSKLLQSKPDAGACDNNLIPGADWYRLVEAFTRTEQDPLDTGLLSFQLAASMAGLTPWEYSKTCPEMYEANGIFYLQMKRDIGLDEKRHGKLPMFPDKVFAYNPNYDRIELCFEPYGHHQIVEGVDEKLLKCEKERNLRRCSTGGRNSSLSGIGKKHTDRVPFQGTGYTLKDSEVKAPQKENIINDIFNVPSKPSVLVRKGPGFSVLSHNNVPENSDINKLHSLTSNVLKDVILLEEEESHSVAVKKSSGHSLHSTRLMPNDLNHMESPAALLSQTAANTAMVSGEYNPVSDMPKNEQELVSINSVHIPVKKQPETNSNDQKNSSSPHGDCAMDESARDCENMLLGKREGSVYLDNTLLEQNLEVPDDTQAMDVDRVAT